MLGKFKGERYCAVETESGCLSKAQIETNDFSGQPMTQIESYVFILTD